MKCKNCIRLKNIISGLGKTFGQAIIYISEEPKQLRKEIKRLNKLINVLSPEIDVVEPEVEYGRRK